eukprot:5812764-Amphidinium_carterae.1
MDKHKDMHKGGRSYNTSRLVIQHKGRSYEEDGRPYNAVPKHIATYDLAKVESTARVVDRKGRLGKNQFCEKHPQEHNEKNAYHSSRRCHMLVRSPFVLVGMSLAS